MRLADDHDEAAFRAELRAWLRRDPAAALLEEAQRGTARGDVGQRFELRTRWHRALHEGGWMGVSWPSRFGGRGLPFAYQIILNEELTAVQAPPIAAWVAVELVAPVLMKWGTPAQQDALLPGILAGETVACQGFSEPGAGSDLAAVSTTARRDGEHWVLDGTKVWTSWAQHSSVAVVLARTDPAQPGHRGLSCFLVDIDTPGLRVEPLRMLHGGAEENWLHLDGVRVGDEALLGEPGRGWRVVMHSLSLARGVSSLTRTATVEVAIARLLTAHSTGAAPLDEVTAHRLAVLHARARALRWLCYRVVGELDQDGVPGSIASTEKLLWARLSRDVAALTLDVHGLPGLTEPTDWAGDTNTAERFDYLRTLADSVEGGTDEIQREILATRVLGLEA